MINAQLENALVQVIEQEGTSSTITTEKVVEQVLLFYLRELCFWYTYRRGQPTFKKAGKLADEVLSWIYDGDHEELNEAMKAFIEELKCLGRSEHAAKVEFAKEMIENHGL